LEVASVSWKRTVDIERFGTVTESDWSVPQGARVISKSREVRSHRKVQAGTETKTRTEKVQTGTRKVKSGVRDKGNGFFEDVYKDEPIYESRTVREEVPRYVNEPVYDTKYRYEIEKWTFLRKAASEGAEPAPQWPKFEADPSQKLREGRRVSAYEVKLREEGKPSPLFAFKPKEERDFVKFALGSKWAGKVNRLGQAFSLRKLGDPETSAISAEEKDLSAEATPVSEQPR
jgi:hypothetical protein